MQLCMHSSGMHALNFVGMYSFVGAWIRLYVCICFCMHSFVRAHMHSFMCTHSFVCIRLCARLHVHASL